jgi:hypothetical protein
MENPTGEAVDGSLRLDFDRHLKLEFHGTRITSDAGLLAYRELDDALVLSAMAEDVLADARSGRNGRHALVSLLRQSVFGRLSGYEDVNDAERLRHDALDRRRQGRSGQRGIGQPDGTLRDRVAGERTEPFGAHRSVRAVGRSRPLPPNARRHCARYGFELKRPVGRPPHHVRRHYANFRYRVASWGTSRRVVAKVEWHPGELYPCVGFIVTNMSRPAERVVAFYNKRGTCEQWIKEGKNAIKWTRLSCCSFAANAVRLQLHALAYNLANFMRTLALPEAVAQWSLTSLREKLIKIGANVVRHARYAIFQMAEVAVPRELFEQILRLIDGLRRRQAPA